MCIEKFNHCYAEYICGGFGGDNTLSLLSQNLLVEARIGNQTETPRAHSQHSIHLCPHVQLVRQPH